MRNKCNAGQHARPRQNEHNLQVACLQWFCLEFAFCRDLIWATPNGGKRDRITAAKMKQEGAKAGVPDLFLALPKKGYHGLFIEMKDGKKGRLSEAQAHMIDKLTEQGYKCAVCRDIEQFRQITREYIL